MPRRGVGRRGLSVETGDEGGGLSGCGKAVLPHHDGAAWVEGGCGAVLWTRTVETRLCKELRAVDLGDGRAENVAGKCGRKIWQESVKE